MNKSMLYVLVPFCGIFIAIGATLMVSTGRKIALGARARSWPTTVGRVLSVNSKDTSEEDTPSREIQVRYAYQIDGHDYESTTIHPTYTSSSFEAAHSGLESLLRTAQQVRVYYDSSQPSVSMLSVGFYSSSLAMFFGGFIFLALGLGFLLTFWFALAGDWDFARDATVWRPSHLRHQSPVAPSRRRLHEIIAPTDSDFASSGLTSTSLVRLGFLALLPADEFLGDIGSISPERHSRLLRRLASYLQVAADERTVA